MKNFYQQQKVNAAYIVLLLFAFFAIAGKVNAQTTIWTENFPITPGGIPAGWSTTNLTTFGNNWAYGNNTGYNSDGPANGHIRLGQNLFFASDAVITTANVAMTAGLTYKLQFKVRTAAASGQNIPLEVRVGSGTGTLANYPNIVHTSTQNGISFTTITTSDFACLATGNYKFAFRAQIPSGSGRTIGIDNVIAIENPPTAMAFASCTVAQASTAAVDRGSSNNAVLNLQIVTTGTASALTCSAITFNTTGTIAPANLTNARLYYTGNTGTFSTATLFGTATANPNGSYTITPGTATTLAGGTNHFWLAYDIDPNAPIGNVVDGQITSCTVGGTARTPTATNPAGTRLILNDNPCGALTLTAGSTCVPITNTWTTSATGSSPATTCTGNADDDVWYTFTATQTSAIVTVDGLGGSPLFCAGSPGYDPVLQFFSSTGSCPTPTLTSFGCIDGSSCGATETVALTGLTIGAVYYVRVFDYTAGSKADGFTICLVNPPANDACAGASTLTINGAAVAGDNTNATVESPLPTTTGCGTFAPTATSKGLWYTFTTTCAGNYTVTAVPTGSFDVEMAAFTGACGSTTGAGCGVAQGAGGTESITITGAPAGTSYYVLVWGYNAASGSFNISVTGPPTSLALSNGGTPVAGTIPAGGTSQLLHGFTLTPACGATTYNLTSVTVNNSGTATASDFSTNAKLYYDADNSGTVNGGDLLITSTPVSSVLTFNISTQTGISGTRQYIIVADVATSAVGGNTFIASATAATANITVNAGTTNGNTRTITPFNDNCAGAFSFGTLSTSGCTSQTVVTSGATQTFAGCTGTADDDVWFIFTMPAGYTSIAYSNINISGNADRVLQFYSGTCGSLTPITPTSCFDPESGTVSGFTGGQTYFVRAYTSANAVNSTFTLCLTVPPVNDNCAGVIAFPTLAPGCTNVTGNTLGATNSGVTTCSGTADDDVWYSFVMPAGYTSLAYSFTNISGDNNRVIQFFNSSCGVGSFSCQTTATGSLSGLTAGNTYWLRVYTSAASPAYSEFTLCLALPPTNDDCAGALPIPSSGSLQPGCNTVAASTAASTATTGVLPAPCSGTADDDVWYQFVISSTTNVGYSITDVSGNNDRVIQVFNACGGSQVYCNTAEAGLLGSLAAGTYYVRVFTAGTGVISDFDLCISLPPANDVPCNAIALASPDDACLPTAGTTQLATASQGTNGVPAACNGTAEDDVWYSFVATSATHTVTVTGSSGFNAAFELYTRSGSCPSATFTAVASSCTNNIATLGSVEALTIRGLTIGTTYFVRVYDAGASAPATPGFTICVVENPTGIPITYYDFELNSNRNGFFETSPEVSVNTASAFTSPGTISGYGGAALTLGIPGVTISGSCVSVGPASAGSLTLAPSNYIEVSLNAAGFQTLSLDFDFQSNWSQFLDLDYPWVAVNLSTDGGTTWSNIADFQVPDINTDIWLFPQYPLILPASCNNNPNIKVRFYGYNSFASSGRIYIDNVTLLAASTVANAGSKTLVNFSTVYTGVTSGLTGSLFVYDKFTANGTGSTVNLLNSNILLSNQLNVTNSGTFNFGVGGTPRFMLGNTLGTASFNVNTLGTVGITDVAGVTATGGTFGNVQCLGTRTYGTDGSYTYFANAAQVTGSGLPATVRNLTIDNAAGVTLTGAGVTINGILGLNNGILRTATFATDNVSITNTGSVSLTNGWVYGNLQKHVATGSSVLRNFEVGTLSNYTPALVTFPSVTTAGNYTAKANPTTFFTGSCLSTSKYLNQVWNLANNSVLPNNYNLILDWNTAGNLVGSPTPANLIVGNYNGSTWSYPTLAVTPNSTVLSATGVSGSGLFQVAEGKTPSVTIAQSPTGAQCVGTSITFTATPTNGGATPNYEFFVNGSSVQNSSVNTYATSTLANGNIVTVTITSNDNCVIFNNSADAPTPITVVINPRPSLSVTNPTAVCAPGTVNITTAATDLNGIPGSTFTYYNDSTSAVNQTGALTTLQASTISVNGVYWVRCTTPAGCFEVRPVTATINNCTTLTWEGGFGGVGQENNWNVATNWDPDFVPTASNDIVIPNRPFDPVLSSGAMGVCKDVSITGGAPISIGSGYTLDVKGSWTGTTATIVSGAGKTIFSGTSAQTISGGGTFSTLQANNASGVTIASGGNVIRVTTALELRAGALTTNGNLQTISSASSTAYINDFSSGFTGSLSGLVSVERFIPPSPNGFRYIGEPVNTGAGVMAISAMQGFTVTGSPGQTIPLPTCSPTFTPINVAINSPYGNLMYFQENGPYGSPACRQRGWWFQTTGNLTVGRGYGIKQGGNTKITYRGTANTGTITSSATSTHTSVFSPAGNNGWNLVSNPYPSAITIDEMGGNPNPLNDMPAGYDKQMQFYITGNSSLTGSYQTYNIAINGAADIALGQGFWVRVTTPGTTPAWTLGQGHRTTQSPTYFDVNPLIESHLKVNVSGNGFADLSNIYFVNGAESGLDVYDGNKWNSATGQPTLYTKAGEEVMGINSLPSLSETMVVPMGLNPGANGNFTFTFEDIASFPQTAMIYLEDLKLGTMNNLRDNATYEFAANLNDSPDRFMLHFQPGLQAEVADQDCDNAGSIELTQPAPTVWSTYEVKGNDNNVYATGTNLSGTVTVSNLPAQEYVVTVTHPSGYSAQEYITVNGSNPISASINASSTLVMVDEMVTLTANATNASEYVWNFGDGNTQTGSANVVHAYNAEGTYNVTLTATNSDCNSEATKIIKVNNNATGLNGTAASNLNIYGQGERVVIEFNKWGGDKADIFMYNTLGQRMESLTGVSTLKGRQELYIADIKPGYYFIQVVSNGEVLGKKVFLGKQ